MSEPIVPQSLVDRIRAGRVALVVGAGVGVPSWRELLAKMNQRLAERDTDEANAAKRDVDDLLAKGNLTRAAGFLARTLGPEACDELVVSTWTTPDELPTVARSLAKLPIRHIWTTFPGDILETAMRSGQPDGWPETTPLTYQQASEISNRKRTLVKILGDFESYVVTPKSVRQALAGADDLREYAREYYISGTLIFVGFRYDDPDLAALLDRVFGVYELPENHHYFVGADLGPVAIEELEHEHQIKVIHLRAADVGKGEADEAPADIADDKADDEADGAPEGEAGDDGDEGSADDKGDTRTDLAQTALVAFLDDLARACVDAGMTLGDNQPDDDDLEGWLEIWDDDAEAAREAVIAIEDKVRAGEDAERLIDVLVGRIEREDSAETRGALLLKLADVFENQMGDAAQAFTASTAAVRENPGDFQTVDTAERLAGDIDAWTELISDVSEVAGEIADKAVAAGYWMRLGHWYEVHTDHPDYAIAAFRQAIKLDATQTAAHAGLEELFRKQQRWADLADALGEHAQVETDKNKQIEVYLALGDLCENQLASTARAVEAYQASAELDKESDDALVALARLYRRDEHWDKLVEVLGQQAALLEGRDPGRAAAIRRQIAALEEDKLGDVQGAIARYEAALEADASDLDALRSLEKLYEKVGRTDDYLRTLERHVAAAGEADKPMLLLRLAAEVEERDSARAIEFYEQILTLEEGGSAIDDAYRALSRLHGRADDPTELIGIIERHIQDTKNKDARAELYGQLAQVYEDRKEDYESAMVAWLSVREIDEKHRGALAALARLYERTGAWERAIATLTEHAELEGQSGADLWQRAGALITDHLDELGADESAGQAEAHLEKALELDAEHRDAMLSLARLHRARQSWGSAVDMLERAERHTPNRLERVAILTDAADLTERELGDRDRALRLRRQVLEIDPDHVEMGGKVAERLLADENWQEVQPILEMLARKADEPAARARAELTLARVLEAQEQLDAAIEHYRLAVEADDADVDAGLALVKALFARARRASNEDEEEDALLARWDEVDTRYRELLARQQSRMDDAVVTDVWHDLGVAARAMNDDKKARGAFMRALENDPRHASSLTALVDVCRALGDHQTELDSQRALLELAPDDAERMRIHTAIGDLMHEHLSDSAGALEAYENALALEPDSHQMMHKMLEVFIALEEWDRAIATLDDLAKYDDSARRRAKYHYTAGVIARDKLEDVDTAVARFDATLADDPEEQRAFTAIDELLTQGGEFKELARAYRRMLKRLGPDAPNERLLPLWSRLASIYTDELHDTEAAIAAMEVVSALEPDSEERHEELANLYLAASDAHTAEAIAELQLLLAKHPERIELYRALSELYEKSDQSDKAYCVARALVFLGAATDAEKELFERHRPARLVVAERRVTDELWIEKIVHPSENRQLSAMFGALMGAIAATTARTAEDFDLRTDQRAEVGREARRVVARVFKYVSDILALDPEPHLYISGDKEGMQVLNTRAGGSLLPSVVVGEPHSSIKDDRLLAFEVAKRLAYLHPERYVTYALGGSLAELESTYTAILWATGVSEDTPTGDAAKMGKHLRKIVPGAVMDQVRAVAVRLANESPAKLVAGWQAATELTANRSGLLLCNDLEIAARLIATDSTAMTTLSPKDRLRDLLAYSVSEPYFEMREHLCLTIGDADGSE